MEPRPSKLQRGGNMSDIASLAGGVKLSTGFSGEFGDVAKEVFQFVPRLAEARKEVAPKPGQDRPAKDAGIRKIDDRKLRACKRCKLLKTAEQFEEQGCSNCPIPKDDDSEDGAKNPRNGKMDAAKVIAMTTLNFEGMVCICTGTRSDSWVCRWQGLNRRNLVPGAYAVMLKAEQRDESDDEENEGAEEDTDDHAAFLKKEEEMTYDDVEESEEHQNAEETQEPRENASAAGAVSEVTPRQAEPAPLPVDVKEEPQKLDDNDDQEEEDNVKNEYMSEAATN
eukprot:TRINITY_DN12843_c0_g1_i1.p1 TRINITY_DN12843_c0_g1~~TRINITY_DN12843_c0_g1_i1.p1  ORF type:complete len:281 (+),score=63.96 TRINITY_DN12843_c0_g1_i1:103-945(+)